MLLYGTGSIARNAVHLVFTGEKVRPKQAFPNPPIAPVNKNILGAGVMTIPVRDLVRMKLSAFQPPELRARLLHIRETE